MSQGVACLRSWGMSILDPDRPDLACQGHGMPQKWDFWTKMPKSEKSLRWSNYKARMHWEMAQTGPQVTKMPFRAQNDMSKGVVRCQNWSKTANFSKKSPKIMFFHFLKKSEKTSFSSKSQCILVLQNRPPTGLHNWNQGFKTWKPRKSGFFRHLKSAQKPVRKILRFDVCWPKMKRRKKNRKFRFLSKPRIRLNSQKSVKTCILRFPKMSKSVICNTRFHWGWPFFNQKCKKCKKWPKLVTPPKKWNMGFVTCSEMIQKGSFFGHP